MGCGCGAVRLAQVAGVMGLVFSVLAIAPPVVSYYVDQEWSVVQPAIQLLQDLLENEYDKEIITKSTLENLKSFLSGFGENIGFNTILVVTVASLNIFMDVFMLIGSCCNVRYLEKAFTT